jgi:hypothetical protein
MENVRAYAVSVNTNIILDPDFEFSKNLCF